MIVHPRENVAVIFLRPKDTALDTIQENFSVTIQPVPVPISTLTEFSDTVKRQMIAVFEKNINIVEYKPIHWGWREGYKMVIDAPKPGHVKLVNAWLLRSRQSYILAFLGDMNKYGKDSIVVDEMIRSFQLQ